MVRPMANLGLYLADMAAWPFGSTRLAEWMARQRRVSPDGARPVAHVRPAAVARHPRQRRGAVGSRPVGRTTATSPRCSSSSLPAARSPSPASGPATPVGPGRAGLPGRHGGGPDGRGPPDPRRAAAAGPRRRPPEDRRRGRHAGRRSKAPQGLWRVDPEATAEGFKGRTALLSPFDRLIHDRAARRRPVRLRVHPGDVQAEGQAPLGVLRSPRAPPRPARRQGRRRRRSHDLGARRARHARGRPVHAGNDHCGQRRAEGAGNLARARLRPSRLIRDEVRRRTAGFEDSQTLRVFLVGQCCESVSYGVVGGVDEAMTGTPEAPLHAAVSQGLPPIRRSFDSCIRDCAGFAAVVGAVEMEPDDLVQDAVTRALVGGRLSRFDSPGAYLRRAIVNASLQRPTWRRTQSASAVTATRRNDGGRTHALPVGRRRARPVVAGRSRPHLSPALSKGCATTTSPRCRASALRRRGWPSRRASARPLFVTSRAVVCKGQFMNDLIDALEHRATRGTPRGADAVFDAAVQAARARPDRRTVGVLRSQALANPATRLTTRRDRQPNATPRHAPPVTKIMLAAAACVRCWRPASSSPTASVTTRMRRARRTEPREALPLAVRSLDHSDQIGTRWRQTRYLHRGRLRAKVEATRAAVPDCDVLAAVGLLPPTTKSVSARRTFTGVKQWMSTTRYSCLRLRRSTSSRHGHHRRQRRS